MIVSNGYRAYKHLINSLNQLLFIFFKKWINQKDLYSLGLKELDYQREPRWPMEMQVLPERVKHITTMPNFTEPFYVRSESMSKFLYLLYFMFIFLL
jgi:hypothetical protein